MMFIGITGSARAYLYPLCVLHFHPENITSPPISNWHLLYVFMFIIGLGGLIALTVMFLIAGGWKWDEDE